MINGSFIHAEMRAGASRPLTNLHIVPHEASVQTTLFD